MILAAKIHCTEMEKTFLLLQTEMEIRIQRFIRSTLTLILKNNSYPDHSIVPITIESNLSHYHYTFSYRSMNLNSFF